MPFNLTRFFRRLAPGPANRRPRHHGGRLRVLLPGGSGFLGRALAKSLLNEGHEVIILTRRPPRSKASPSSVQYQKWDGETTEGWGHLVEGIDAIVNLTGQTIGGTNLKEVLLQRWTPSRKREILESRVHAGGAIVEAIRDSDRKPRVLLQMSASGYYGHRPAGEQTEASPPGDDFLSRVCVAWEAATKPAEGLGVRRIVARTGIVLSRQGGLLPIFALPFRMFVGGPLGSGRQGLTWVHLEDLLRAMQFLLGSSSASGVYNITAPKPASNAEMGRAIARTLRRPYWLPVPEFALRLALGGKAMLVLEGQRVVPRRLLEEGFTFLYPDLDQALPHLMGNS